MADKNWNDKLRERMSEFEQTPPEGLWEALESSGAVGRKAGAAAGAGLLSRLFGGSAAPVWWSLAGVAAVAAAVLLLRTPGTELPVVVTPETTVAEVVEPDSGIEETEPEAATEEVEVSEPAVQPVVAPVRSQKAPVANTKASNPVVAVSEPVEEPALADAPADNQVAPVEPVSVEATEPEGESVVPDQSKQPTAPSGSPVAKPAPGKQAPSQGSTVVPLSRNIKRTRPLLAASLVGGGIPGGPYTNTETVYSLASPPRMASSGNRSMALVSRNKQTEVQTSHRIDYQVGLMVSYNFTKHLGIESGVELTHLGSVKTSTSGSLSTVTEESFDYLGVPLRLVYTPLQLGRLSGYISAGPEVEWGITHLWRSSDNLDNNYISGSDCPGDWVFSGNINAGLQYSPWNSGAFFIQPGVVYRVTGERALESYYTTHPWSFRISAGYRIIF